MKLQPGIKLEVSGFSSYKVFLDGVEIGSVERSTRELNLWHRHTSDGGFGSHRTRKDAIDALIELAEQV